MIKKFAGLKNLLEEFDDDGSYVGASLATATPVDNDVLDTEDLDPDEIEDVQDEASDGINSLLDTYGFDDIRASVEDDGENQTVTFIDADGDIETVIFGVDESGAFAMVSGQNDEDSEDSIVINLDFLDPTYTDDGELDLTNPSWLTKEAMISILAPLATNEQDVDESGESFLRTPKMIELEEGTIESLKDMIANARSHGKRFTGKFRMAMRGGQVVRIPLFQRVKKANLSPKQKAALRKMLAKAHSARAIAKRVMSFKKGERFHKKPVRQHEDFEQDSFLMLEEMECPKCGSTDIKDKGDGDYECNECGEEWHDDGNKEEVDKEENESFEDSLDEGKRGVHGWLTNKQGWTYDKESRSYKHPDLPGHEIVNNRDKVHHLYGNEPVSSLTQRSKTFPQEVISSYVRKLHREARKAAKGK